MTGKRSFRNYAALIAGLALAACTADQIAEEDAPVVKVSGEIAAGDGGTPKGCKLGLYDTAALKPTHEWDVDTRFDFEFQSKAVLNKFYFSASCEGYRMAARSEIYSMGDLSRGDFALDLARLTVGQGEVTVKGKVAAADGSTPKACTLDLYTGFHSKPVKSWTVSGDFSQVFNVEDVDNHFRFEVSCKGYAKPFKSVKRSEDWLAQSGGTVDLGVATVRK